MKYIHVPLLIASFVLGLVYIYLIGPALKPVYIYPSPDNYTKLLYKDSVGTCFQADMKYVECPAKPDKIPVQLD